VDPLFSEYGDLKVRDLYRQQLRLHAWKFWNDRLLDSQAATLKNVDESYGYGTKFTRSLGRD
jgi:hypothetical protein